MNSKRLTANFLATIGYALVALSSTSVATADVNDFGGFNEKFKGGGDKIPPACQVDIPTGSKEPFAVKWSCSDDNANTEDIRTELWIYRKGWTSGQVLTTFLGFPAAAFIDASVLGSETFAGGMPVGFRLAATDRAGNTTLTGMLNVALQDNTLDSCDLTITTEATDSTTEGSTGVPASTATASKAKVSVASISDGELRIATSTAAAADPCEIDSLCDDDDELTFVATVELPASGSGDSSGTLSISPGALEADLSGTVSVNDSVLESLEMSGTTSIDGVDADVTLSCNQ